MKTKIPKKIDPVKFAKWLKANTRCDVKIVNQRVKAVISAVHIEPDRCVPLIAEMNDEILEITEFTNDYYSLPSALAAIENGDDTFSPVPFYDWVKDQYLTAKDVKITKVEI